MQSSIRNSIALLLISANLSTPLMSNEKMTIKFYYPLWVNCKKTIEHKNLKFLQLPVGNEHLFKEIFTTIDSCSKKSLQCYCLCNNTFYLQDRELCIVLIIHVIFRFIENYPFITLQFILGYLFLSSLAHVISCTCSSKKWYSFSKLYLGIKYLFFNIFCTFYEL